MLISLAVGSLGFGIGAQQNEGWILDETIKKQLEQELPLRKTLVSAAAKGSGDAFKDGIKNLVGPIVHWLSYLAQQKVGSEKVKKGNDEIATTILHNVVERGDFLYDISAVSGVLFVDAYVDEVSPDRWTVTPIGGHLSSVSVIRLPTCWPQ